MGVRVTWCGGNCPWPWCQDQMIFRVPSNPKHSVISMNKNKYNSNNIAGNHYVLGREEVELIAEEVGLSWDPRGFSWKNKWKQYKCFLEMSI